MTLTTVSPALLDTQAQYTGFKNRIINGDMRIDQRNAGAAITPSAVVSYGVDRFNYVGTQTSKLTLQRVSDAPSGFKYSTKLSVAASASATAGDQFRYTQNIEGFNCSDLNWGSASAQDVAVSFYAKASVAGTYSVALWNDTFNNYSYVSAVSLTSTWNKYTIIVPGATAGSWNTENTGGISLIFDLGGGSNWTTSNLNTWQAGGAGPGYFKAAGSVSLISNAGATLNITGVQLEKGSTATAFDYRDYGRELIQCQRYFENVQWITNGYAAQWTGAEFFGLQYPFMVEKRASPSIASFTSFGYWVAAGQNAFSALTTHNFTITTSNTKGFGARSNRPAGNATPTQAGMYLWESGVTIPVSAEL
jgi:hypothetical protein